MLAVIVAVNQHRINVLSRGIDAAIAYTVQR